MMKRRFIATLIDYCLILAWLALLAAIFVPLSLASDRWWEGISIDVFSFVVTILPVWLYLTVTEASKHHATFGKRRTGLKVVGVEGEPAATWRVALRNAVKLLPWQLAHLGLVPLWTAGATASLVPASASWYPIAATYALVAVTVAMALLRKDRAALHDVIAGTRVISTRS